MRENYLSDSINVIRIAWRKILEANKLFENHDAIEVCCNYSLLLKLQMLKLWCVYVEEEGSEESVCDFTSENALKTTVDLFSFQEKSAEKRQSTSKVPNTNRRSRTSCLWDSINNYEKKHNII